MIIPMELGADSYDIVLEKGALKKAGEYLNLNRRVLIVTDTGVPEIYAKSVAKACKMPVLAAIEPGEAHKTLESFQMLLRTMLENGFSRKDCVVAVGGGVVGDLAGFAASAYMRGVDFYNIPTTLLSQVDSSIGGKTAVNLDDVKNIVGAFYQPKRVLIDEETLQTLSRRQIAAGLAESIKMSLTSDAKLFEIFETETIEDNLETIIERSLRIKKSVVEQDEKEQGLRKILNFGHTIGHGYESTSKGALYHGEAVALGMLPMCSAAVRDRLLPVLEKVGLPTSWKAEDADKVFEAVTHDKKGANGRVSIVRVEEVGSFLLEDVPVEQLKSKIGSF